MTQEVFTFIRWIHVICGAAWFGEVVVINFVLIPALSKYQGAYKKDFLNTIFSKIFVLASVLAAITAITGGLLLYSFIGFDLQLLTQRGAWGWSILIGGSLGLILTLFHFFVENQLAKKVGVGNPDISQDAVEDVHLKLKFIPRMGMIVITLILLLMLNAAHKLIGF